MSKSINRVNDLMKSMDEFMDEMKKRHENLKDIVNSMNTALDHSKLKETEAEHETGKLENEVKLLTNNIDSEKKSLSSNKEALTSLGPDMEQKGSELNTLKTEVDNLKVTYEETKTNIDSKEKEKENLNEEFASKNAANKSLEKEIEEAVKTNQSSLDEAKSRYDDTLEKFAIWDYLFSQMEGDDIEIMAIVSENRNVTLENIKKLATRVSPVMVGRALSKLEADGKLTQDESSQWDIAPAYLEVST